MKKFNNVNIAFCVICLFYILSVVRIWQQKQEINLEKQTNISLQNHIATIEKIAQISEWASSHSPPGSIKTWQTWWYDINAEKPTGEIDTRIKWVLIRFDKAEIMSSSDFDTFLAEKEME